MASAHDIPRHICPYCLKPFDNANALKTHQKRKKHTADKRGEYGKLASDMRRYHHEKIARGEV